MWHKILHVYYRLRVATSKYDYEGCITSPEPAIYNLILNYMNELVPGKWIKPTEEDVLVFDVVLPARHPLVRLDMSLPRREHTLGVDSYRLTIANCCNSHSGFSMFKYYVILYI